MKKLLLVGLGIGVGGFILYKILKKKDSEEIPVNVFYLDVDHGDDDNDGLTKETAFASWGKLFIS